MKTDRTREDLYDIASKLQGVDRFTEPCELPEGYRHIVKEVFEYDDLIIKKTNHSKNRSRDLYLFENERYWLEKLKPYNFAPTLMESFYIGRDLYLIMNKLPGHPLKSVYDGNSNWNTADFRKKLKTCFKEFLDVFKKLNLTHKDLRPHNIMVNQDMSILGVIDYQFCSRVGEKIKVNGFRQRRHYRLARQSVGGKWRKPGLTRFNFETDEYMLDFIIKQLSSLAKTD